MTRRSFRVAVEEVHEQEGYVKQLPAPSRSFLCIRHGVTTGTAGQVTDSSLRNASPLSLEERPLAASEG